MTTRMTPAEWLELRAQLPAVALANAPKGKKGSKYLNEKTDLDGLKFDSKLEAKRWATLQVMERAGLISDLQRQVVFELIPAAVINGSKRPAIRYVADFVYREDAVRVVEDVKGVRNQVYRIKQHLMKTQLGIEIRETKA